ncbi:MAG: pantetheine-phosphate adenylyltransferase [Desulfobulbus propionicus]|nr:MAG: pantetheine-phosphate adenylyltransferase [Desulfobulbus propionicus]
MTPSLLSTCKRDLDHPAIGIYPGTFDPLTNGHLDIINRALCMFDKVIVAVAVNPGKSPLFTLEERLDLIRQCFPEGTDRLEACSTSGLIVDFAVQKKAKAIIRGLRAVSDFDYEFQLALMNRKLERRVDTVFLMTGFRWIYISSSIIKEAARNKGNISELVPAPVEEALQRKYASRNNAT